MSACLFLVWLANSPENTELANVLSPKPGVGRSEYSYACSTHSLEVQSIGVLFYVCSQQGDIRPDFRNQTVILCEQNVLNTHNTFVLVKRLKQE